MFVGSHVGASRMSMHDSKEIDMLTFEQAKERTLNNVQNIQEMLLDKTTRFEASKSPPHKYSPPAKAGEKTSGSTLYSSLQQSGAPNAASGSTMGTVGLQTRMTKNINSALEENRQQIRAILKESAKVCKQYDPE